MRRLRRFCRRAWAYRINGRDFGTGLSTLTNWIANFAVGANFLWLLNNFGRAQTFWLSSGVNVVFLWITFFLVPETKHITLEHMERKPDGWQNTAQDRPVTGEGFFQE